MASGLVTCALVAVGGALGCSCRYIADKMPLLAGAPFYRTMCINITGSLLIGIIAAAFSHTGVSESWHRFVITGFLGGFTTYSAFSLDSVRLLQSGRWQEAAVYITATVICCIAACAAGTYVTGRVIRILHS